MENIGIGVDIEDINRFIKLDSEKDRAFFEKVYNKREEKYCLSKPNPASCLAARFAGKEAVIKAISSLIGKPVKSLNYREIEILKNKKELPETKINNKKFRKLNILISLSHCKDKAIAFAIVTR